MPGVRLSKGAGQEQIGELACVRVRARVYVCTLASACVCARSRG